MNQSNLRPSALAFSGLYFFSALLLFWPLVDLVSSSWPLQPGAVEYRYGFMGLLAGFLHTPTLGLILAMVTAYSLEHLQALRALSAVCLLGALVILLVLILFPLDVLQMKSLTAPESHAMLKTGAILAELKHFTGMVALALLGLGGWKTAGWLKEDASGVKKKKGPDGGARTADLAIKPSKPQEPAPE